MRTNKSFIFALSTTILLDLLCISLIVILSAVAFQSSTWVFSDQYAIKVLKFTILQAFFGSALSIFFALVSVFSVRRIQNTNFGKIFTTILNLPFFIPSIVGCLSLILLLGQGGFFAHLCHILGLPYQIVIYGVGGIILCHVFYYTPFALRIFNKSLDMIQPEYGRLSQQIGLSRFDQFRYVEWPFLKNDLFSTFGIIFMYCLRSFTTVLILGGTPKTTTLEVSIFQAINFDGDLEMAAQLALAQFLTTISFLGFFRIFSGERQKTKPPLQKKAALAKIKFIDKFLILSSGIFFLLPLILVVMDGMNKKILPLLVSVEFKNAFFFSLILGISTAALTLMLAFSLVYGSLFSEKLKKFKKTFAFFIELAGNTSILFSSTVLGAAIYFLFFNKVRETLFMFGIIIFLNSIMFLPSVVRIIKTPVQAQYSKYERLCMLLNIRGFEKWRKIDWPVLKEPIGYSILTCIIFSLGDAKTILFFNPAFENLTSLLYRKMSLHEFDSAASVGTLLLFISFLIAAGLKKLFRGNGIDYDQS